MKRLSKDQVIAMHRVLLQKTGGLEGIRDDGGLESALEAPFQTFDRMPLYRTIEMKAARLGYGLVQNHPFVDGNKRIGILAMLVFLELNGVSISCTDQEVVEIGLTLAAGEMTVEALQSWILEHSV